MVNRQSFNIITKAKSLPFSLIEYTMTLLQGINPDSGFGKRKKNLLLNFKSRCFTGNEFYYTK